MPIADLIRYSFIHLWLIWKTVKYIDKSNNIWLVLGFQMVDTLLIGWLTVWTLTWPHTWSCH